MRYFSEQTPHSWHWVLQPNSGKFSRLLECYNLIFSRPKTNEFNIIRHGLSYLISLQFLNPKSDHIHSLILLNFETVGSVECFEDECHLLVSYCQLKTHYAEESVCSRRNTERMAAIWRKTNFHLIKRNPHFQNSFRTSYYVL